jgi:hypothetical protein
VAAVADGGTQWFGVAFVVNAAAEATTRDLWHCYPPGNKEAEKLARRNAGTNTHILFIGYFTTIDRPTNAHSALSFRGHCLVARVHGLAL